MIKTETTENRTVPIFDFKGWGAICSQYGIKLGDVQGAWVDIKAGKGKFKAKPLKGPAKPKKIKGKAKK